jgi:integrase
MYRAKIVQTQRVFLYEEELRALMNKEISITRLIRVRDIFLFCCFTGLAYVDVRKIGPQNVFTDEDNRPWIAVNRTKTSAPSNVPLLPAAFRIIGKYQEHPYCKARNRLLPVLSNQKMNSYLKEIADCCGIRKDLTFHTARHTFATTITRRPIGLKRFTTIPPIFPRSNKPLSRRSKESPCNP